MVLNMGLNLEVARNYQKDMEFVQVDELEAPAPEEFDDANQAINFEDLVNNPAKLLEWIRKKKLESREIEGQMRKKFVKVLEKLPIAIPDDEPKIHDAQKRKADASLMLEDKKRAKKRQKPMKKKKKKVINNNSVNRPVAPRHAPAVPATMPRELLNAIINEYGGDNVVWVIEKTLTATDVSGGHNRLSIPENQVKLEEFLNDAEIRQASNKEEIPVDVLVLVMGAEKPELWNLNFKKWVMNRSSIYVLIKNWSKLVVNKHLHNGDTVQIWSYRASQNGGGGGGGKKLCFAINVLQ
ncbi:putative B3 domain-containing protein At2g27410 [Telopea speciosissima]|uniref:putative B3 domain-containing protein At2g27410 n=1 Tax=Telopea speciosissima TaxID=54955 RepID=UPI001CC3ADB1|nr:putative B3 domain-containing protein At2g27410 [Telopea speciosissima]